MKSLIIDIGLMKESKEKDILTRAYFDARKYTDAKDKEALKTVISRLNSTYPQMSRKARKTSIKLVKAIKEIYDKI